MKLATCKSALNPTVVYSTDRSKAVDPLLSLTLCCLVVLLRGRIYTGSRSAGPFALTLVRIPSPYIRTQYTET